jgi:hypothetical protein
MDLVDMYNVYGRIASGNELRPRLVWTLKFNKHCSIFVLFDKKFLIFD